MAIIPRFDPDVPADIVQAVVDTFDFTLPGVDGSLGRDLAATAAVGIAIRSNQGLDVAGVSFAKNEDEYAKYKKKRYSVDHPGELGGQMLSLKSLKGETAVEPASVVITYGTGEKPPDVSRAGVPLTESEKKLTDREKAQYFTDSGRPFFELDDAIKAEMVKVAQDALDTHIREANG